MKKILFYTVILSSLILGSSKIFAAPVAINSMFVDSATVSLDAGVLGSATATSGLPDIEITMGAYQSNIFTVGSGNLNVRIYSTDAFGMVAPSGYVDGTLINVDFSSFRADVTYGSYTFDVELWPLTTTLDYGLYDPSTSNYTIGWNEVISIDVSSYLPAYPATLDVSLSGYLTAVPVPAAFWLFGTGLIGLAGLIKRKSIKVDSGN